MSAGAAPPAPAGPVPERLVSLRLAVPAGTVEGGSLTITGMDNSSPAPGPSTNLTELLAALRTVPHNNHLVAQPRVTGPDGERTVQRVVTLDQVVTGVRDFPVAAI